MGFHKALYGLYLKMVVEMETSCWSGSVITPTTGKMVVEMEPSCWSGAVITPTTGAIWIMFKNGSGNGDILLVWFDDNTDHR